MGCGLSSSTLSTNNLLEPRKASQTHLDMINKMTWCQKQQYNGYALLIFIFRTS
jgi:hypothetical protein